MKFEEKTTEYSFMLKPSQIEGVGVFAVHGIAKGTALYIFRDEGPRMRTVPADFKKYCVNLKNGLLAPLDFGQMAVGWYLNHSFTPNAYQEQYQYFAARDIEAGEEITINYRTLNEVTNEF
jgi:SET domain-containing protein